MVELCNWELKLIAQSAENIRRMRTKTSDAYDVLGLGIIVPVRREWRSLIWRAMYWEDCI